MVKTYSLKEDGVTKASPNFAVREFACKGGGDEVLICEDLTAALEKIRAHFDGRPVLISSGYRDPKYNAKINGAKASQHLYGKAVDIRIPDVTPRAIAQYADSLGLGGVGLYEYKPGQKPGFCHVDTRSGRARWLQTDPNGGATSVKYFGASNGTSASESSTKLWRGCKGDAVRELQVALKRAGYDPGPLDGSFGELTETALRAFQRAKGLTVDGVAGPQTGKALGVM